MLESPPAAPPSSRGRSQIACSIGHESEGFGMRVIDRKDSRSCHMRPYRNLWKMGIRGECPQEVSCIRIKERNPTMRPRTTFLGGWLGASLALGLILLGITGQEAKAELFNLNSSNTNFGIAAPFATVNQIETGLPSGVSVRFVVSVSASAAAAGGTLGEFALNIASANVTNATLV